MSARYNNMSTEIARAVVLISETGSLTRAADALGLSQPAVSSQIKRIEKIVGSPVFRKTPNGSTLTEVGRLVLVQARAIIEANDRLFALGGSLSESSPVRVGLSSIVVRECMDKSNLAQLSNFQYQSGSSPHLVQSLLDGRIDIACIFVDPEQNLEIERLVVRHIELPVVWVRAQSFVLSPGRPIPIVTWASDQWMMRTLNRSGVSFRVVFSGEDYDAKRAAVEAGLGVTAVPERFTPPTVVKADEYYLPKLPSIKMALCVRSGAPPASTAGMVQHLTATLFDTATGVSAEAPRPLLQPARSGHRTN